MTGHERKSVLVVDDEQDIVTIIKFALEKKGFTVTGFTDPVLALQHFDQHPADYGIVLLDIRMPHMSGFELARKINAANLQVKVLLMTAFEINKSEFKKVLPSTR